MVSSKDVRARAVAGVIAAIAVVALSACGSSGKKAEAVQPDATTKTTTARASAVPAATAVLVARNNTLSAQDANGRMLKTLATSAAGTHIRAAQLTKDHKTIWYQAGKGDSLGGCGDVFSKDLASGIVTKRALDVSAFAIDAAGTKLATAPGCAAHRLDRRLLNLATNVAATYHGEPTTTDEQGNTVDKDGVIVRMAFSPAGDELATLDCFQACISDVWNVASGSPAKLAAFHQRKIEGQRGAYAVAWTSTGLYFVDTTDLCCESYTGGGTFAVYRYDSKTLALAKTVAESETHYWIHDIAPTPDGLFVTASKFTGHGPTSYDDDKVPHLYRVGTAWQFVDVTDAEYSGMIFPVS